MSIYDGVQIYQDPLVFSGRPVIEDHRVTVHDVVALHQQGESPESIAEEYDLTLREVKAALSYYRDNKRQIERELAEDRQITSQLADRDMSARAERIRAAWKIHRGRARHG